MRRPAVVLHVLSMLLIVSAAITMVPSADTRRFRQVARGIEHVMLHVQPPDADPFSGHAFKIDLDVAELRLIPAGGPTSRRTVEEIVASYAAVVAINASFFDQEGRTMGLAVDKGRLIASSKRLSWGALVIDDTQARIVLGAEVDAPLGYRLVVQGIPRLVVGGKVPQLKPQVAERTAVCADGSRVVLVVSISTKAETTAFARFLADPPDKGGLGCRDALNLDGGPSTQLVAKLPTLALSEPRGWGVPNALVVVPGGN